MKTYVLLQNESTAITAQPYLSSSKNTIANMFLRSLQLRLQLHGAIYRPDSFVWMLRYCANLKGIRYESTSLKRIVGDESHCVIVALYGDKA